MALAYLRLGLFLSVIILITFFAFYEYTLGVTDSKVLLNCLNETVYSDILDLISREKARIWNDWDISAFPLFLTMMNIPADSWETQKRKFIKLILGFSDDSVGGESFVVGFSGSSVTAGHDNFFNESFPNIFYQSTVPVFRALGVKLVVRNHALGNNPCYPYDICLSTHLGDDLDILTWEQSMNCGRDARPVEAFARAALRMRKAPSVIFIASGTPVWQCVNKTERPTESSLSDQEKTLLAVHLKDAANLYSSHLASYAFLKTRSQVRLDEAYSGITPMAQSVHACAAYKCNGPYSASFGLKTPGGGNLWHPGRLGHKLRGDNLAFFMLSIIEDALLQISPRECPGLSHRHHENGHPKTATTPLQLRPTNALAALRVRDKVHTIVTDRRYNRSNASRVLSPSPSSESLMMDTKAFLRRLSRLQRDQLEREPVSCGAAECKTTALCYTDYEPRVQNSLSAIVMHDRFRNVSSNWTREISFFDKAAIRKAEARGLGYKDRKYIFLSHGIGDFISFNVTVTRPSGIWICELQKGFLKYPDWIGDLDRYARVYARRLSSSRKEDVFPLSLVPVADQCYKINGSFPLNAGIYSITVVQRENKQINIAYVVSW